MQPPTGTQPPAINPATQQDRRAGTRIPPWVFLAAVVMVVVGALATEVILLRAAQRDRRDVVNLANLFVESNDLRNSQWTAIGVAQDEGIQAAGEPLAAFIQAKQTFSADGSSQTVQASLEPWLADLDTVIAQMEQGNVDQAFIQAAQVNEPAFNDGINAISRSTADAANHADATGRIALSGSIIAMVAATGLIGLLFWRFERSTEAMRSLQLEQDALRRSEARFRPLVQNSSDMIMIVERDLTIRYASPAAERLLDRPVGELVGVGLTNLTHPDNADQIAQLLTNTRPGEMIRTEAKVRVSDGSYRHAELVGTNLVNDENVLGFVLNVRDMTERKTLEDQLRHQAFHDSLTVLPNRARLHDRVEQALIRARRQQTSIALLFLDLDDFKTINDTLGHSAGDEVLVHVAERLRTCLREQDTASRLGGDEFAILLEDIAQVGDATAAADRIFEELKAPFSAAGHQFGVQASIGIALSSVANEASVETLLRNADIAMYVAKARGKGRFELYDERMQEGRMEKLALRADLEQALEKNELELYYQPIFEISSNHVVSVEALLRWHHPELGLISAVEFIPLAEESGLIVPMGSWVLREACKRWRAWRDAHPAIPPFTMSVNISVKQVDQAGFVKEVEETIRETGMDASALILEITESAPVRDAERFLGRLQQFKELGVQLALDDFGTGHSSFNYLRSLPVDILKIDRSFIDAMSEGEDRQSLVRAIIDVGQSLGLQIVPEGVEQVDQAAMLTKMGCLVAQGYYFSRPVAAGEFERILMETSSQIAA